MSLINSIMSLDDEILIGWSNKGLVKRAYKDLEKEQPVLSYESEKIKAQFTEVTCEVVEPLKNSTCSCKSRELCRHVLVAFIYIQQEEKRKGWSADKTNEDISSTIEEKKGNAVGVEDNSQSKKLSSTIILKPEELEAIKEICQLVCCQMEYLLEHGMIRGSEYVMEQLELIAVLCHKNNLATLEKKMRQLHGQLASYVKRSPSVNLKYLLSDLVDIITYTKQMMNMNEETVVPYLGNFKEEYQEIKDLTLLPIGQRMVHTDSGYEGMVYYFHSQNIADSRHFYTFSQLRPTFYETGRKKVNSRYGMTAPWGLDVTMDYIMKHEIRLEKAKVFEERLSSSQSIQATLLKPVELACKEVFATTYDNFHMMVDQEFESVEEEDVRQNHLVLLLGKRCISSKFDEIHQMYQMVIEDAHHNALDVLVTYKGVDQSLVEMMENIGENLIQHQKENFILFGNAYIENGRCCIYPIELYEDLQIPEKTEFGSRRKYPSSGESLSDFQGVQQLSQYFELISQNLHHILQTGLSTYEEFAELEQLQEQAVSFGLGTLAQYEQQLIQRMKQMLHEIQKDDRGAIHMYLSIYEYITIGTEKLRKLQALSNLKA